MIKMQKQEAKTKKEAIIHCGTFNILDKFGLLKNKSKLIHKFQS
jgi:hypothetical protein